jgi:hypothetical protein
MDLFGVVGQENCLIFYFLAVFSFALMIITLFIGIFSSKQPWLRILLAVLSPFVAYYMYRILYSMCVNSL